MKLCSYVVRYDHGFAPNPYWGYCTMACCKAPLRLNLTVNDWVVGTSSKTRHGTATFLVYAMRITELLSFDEYAKDTRFVNKIPRYGSIEQRGDNIYYRDEQGIFRQRVPSYHSRGLNRIREGSQDKWIIQRPWEEHEGRKAKDLGGKNVPISSSDNFWYFGCGKELPEEFRWVIFGTQGYKCDFSKSQVDRLLNWITSMEPGKHGEPCDFNRTPLISSEHWKYIPS